MSFGSDERGVSNVVAVTLLIGLTLTGVIVILATGFVTIGDTNQQAKIQLAEETMLQIESAFQQTSGGNTTISFPDQLEGSVEVSNSQTYNLTLNENTKCSTGERPLSSIEYEDNGETVAYEGGGVWRMTESGATMVSPPDVTYDEGSLSVAFTEVDGQIQTTSELRTTVNTSEQRIHQYNLSRALYTEGTYDTTGVDSEPVCPPSQVENATLLIENSEYARAWAEWARENHDSNLVTVRPTGTVDPGDTVNITYQLGDTSAPNFEVSDVRATRASAGDPVTVEATVENTGGLRDTRTVTFNYARPDGTVLASETKSIGLGGGDDKRVTFEIDDADLETGSNDITVSASNSVSETLELDDTDGVPQTSLDITDVPRSAAVGTSPSGADVTVTNNGEMTAFERVTLFVNGSRQATWEVTVPPTSSRDIYVGDALPTGNSGKHELVFSGDIASSDETRDPFSVGENGYFGISSVAPPTDVDEGSTATVTATVTNTGAESLQGPVTIEIFDADTGGLVANETPAPTPNLRGTASAAGAESETVSLDATLGSAGNYTYRIETPNETQSGRFRVGEVTGPNFIVTSLSVGEDPVDLGNETTFSVTVTNTGTESGNQTVWLNNTNTDRTLDSETVSLDPAENWSKSWDVTVDNDRFTTGTNLVNTSTANVTLPTNLDVSDPGGYTAQNGTITVTESLNATITMEGAELEYNGYNYETSGPTVMTLVIENSTGTYERTLWEDVPGTGANVNQPLAEARMFQDSRDNPYTVDLSLEPGTNLSLYGTSYYCDRDSYSGIIHDRTPRDTYGYECVDRGDLRLEISKDTNPNNVVIRGNGEEVPQYDAAYASQLTLDQMLGDSQIEEVDGEGVLNLSQGEEVFLFELSDANAFPGSETRPVVGDYNDAIARFQITENNRTVRTPPEFEITDVDLPVRVDQGNDAVMEVTVRNTGGQTGETPVRMTFDGGSQVESKTTDRLANNETDTVSFTVDTGSQPVGSYIWTANATATDGAEQTGFVYVGQPTTPFFQVSAVNGPAVADVDEPTEAEITISNTGTEDDTQQVILEAQNDDNSSAWLQIDSNPIPVDAQTSTDITLDLPSERGNWSYRVRTENVTTSQQSLFVGYSNVYVPETNSINIAGESYDTGTLIERKGSVSTISVELANNGTVGDEREVQLTVNGSDYSATKQVGNGDLTGQGPVPAFVDFTPGLGTGYYSYTITVYNDTASDGPGYTTSGELFLRATGGEAESDDSPVSVDSGTITVG